MKMPKPKAELAMKAHSHWEWLIQRAVAAEETFKRIYSEMSIEERKRFGEMSGYLYPENENDIKE